jgi:hypothetical protein
MIVRYPSLAWTLGLYAAALLAVVYTIAAISQSGAIVPAFLLAPILAILLPPVRERVRAKLPASLMPSPQISLGIAFVLLVIQLVMFAGHIEEKRLTQQQRAEHDSAVRIAKVKKDREAEYARDKATIIGQVEALLETRQPREALALANKFLAVNKDPDLGRLQYRAELMVMKLELQDEKAVPLERRAQIYSALIKEEPGGFATYKTKLSEVNEVMAAQKKLREAQAAKAEFERGIEGQFSKRDGSHRNVERTLKESLKDPSSYEHVETRYVAHSNSLTVYTSYRAKNSFGAKVLNSAVAEVDAGGNVLSLTSR